MLRNIRVVYHMSRLLSMYMLLWCTFGISVVVLFSKVKLLIVFVHSQLQLLPENYSKESYANSSLGRRRINAMVEKNSHSVIIPPLSFYLLFIGHMSVACRKQITRTPLKPIKAVMHRLSHIINLLISYRISLKYICFRQTRDTEIKL